MSNSSVSNIVVTLQFMLVFRSGCKSSPPTTMFTLSTHLPHIKNVHITCSIHVHWSAGCIDKERNNGLFLALVLAYDSWPPTLSWPAQKSYTIIGSDTNLWIHGTRPLLFFDHIHQRLYALPPRRPCLSMVGVYLSDSGNDYRNAGKLPMVLGVIISPLSAAQDTSRAVVSLFDALSRPAWHHQGWGRLLCHVKALLVARGRSSLVNNTGCFFCKLNHILVLYLYNLKSHLAVGHRRLGWSPFSL